MIVYFMDVTDYFSYDEVISLWSACDDKQLYLMLRTTLHNDCGNNVAAACDMSMNFVTI